MTKSELRKIYKTRRSTLTVDRIDDLSLAIANQTLKLPIWDLTTYHLFLSITELKEVNTEFILNILSGKDKNTVISKSNLETGNMMHFLLTDNTKIKKNAWNIPEPIDGIPIDPSTINVVFIPLLAFDTLGNRVGYGKGYYDKFLSACDSKTIKIGLSFFKAEDSIEDMSENDIRLDYCVTPQTLYSF